VKKKIFPPIKFFFASFPDCESSSSCWILLSEFPLPPPPSLYFATFFFLQISCVYLFFNPLQPIFSFSFAFIPER